MGARALFLSLPLHGHTNPTLPLVQELAARGDEIVYYSVAAFEERVARSGARYRQYQIPFLSDMRQLPEQTDRLAWLLMRTTAEVLDRELDGFRAEAPDYVMTDSVAPWGQWTAKILKVPVVTSVSTFAINRHVAAYGFSHGVRPKSVRLVVSKLKSVTRAFVLRRQLCRRYGVRGPGVMASVFGCSDLNIVYTSRRFQPCAETFDDRFVFVGPSIAARGESDEFPWHQVTHDIVVYASLGTLFNRDASFARACFDAFRDESAQVILSVGANVPENSVGAAPPNFVVRRYVPQLDVLRRASVFVTHGGMNSVSESLSCGVPMVVIPQMGEQAIVARRVEELGAGVYLAREALTAERLRSSVKRVLDDDRFRRQAAVIRESFASAGGVARAADAITAFTRGNPQRAI